MNRLTSLTLLVFLLSGAVMAKIGDKPNPYDKIEEQAQAVDVLKSVQADMQKHFGLSLRMPVAIHLVHESEMDKLFTDSPYKGAEIGLYTGVKDGRHQVYVMKGWNRDKCSGITAHELTHAWQTENALRNQEQALVEGFAMWVEYKYLDIIGAYALALDVRDTADPVYGVGIKAMLALEDRIGPKGVVQKVRSARSVKDLQ